MTTKPDRLQKRSDFLQAHKYGRKQVASGFLIQMRKRRDHHAEPDHEHPRVGFTASKKTGNAVLRNSAKRRMRALGREILIPRAKQGTDYVLIARPEIHSLSYAQLVEDLVRSLDAIDKPRHRSGKPRMRGGKS